jgi:plastocyanin
MNFMQYRSTGKLLACSLLLAALSAGSAQAAEADTVTVRIDNFSFSPDTLTVKAGTTVHWVNHDDIPHTVVSADTPRLFKSAPMDSDGQFSYTFNSAGSYQYFCSIHPHMVGRVIVK